MAKRLVLGIGVLVIVVIGVVWWVVRQAIVVPQGESKRLTVAATIFPLADIARQVAGEGVNVILIIPPGVTEHSHAVTPQQLQQLQSARALFHIGHGLEDKLTERIKQTLPDLRLVSVDSGITLRQFDKSLGEAEDEPHDLGADPHYWLIVPNAKKIAATIAENLQQLDPEHVAEYQANLKQYHVKLDSLEKELQAAAKSASKKEFIAIHNAWSYVAAQYGFRLVATYEPVEGQEPSLADLQHIRKLVQQYGLKTFYAEPQKASTAVTNFMQREFGLTVRTLDPVGGGPGQESYVELMRFNMEQLTAPE